MDTDFIASNMCGWAGGERRELDGERTFGYDKYNALFIAELR